jgi:hypothetical protein
LGGVELVDAGIQVPDRQVAGVDQRFAAVLLSRGQHQASACSNDGGFGPFHIGDVRRRVDGEKQIALLDQGALAEMRLDNRACDARANFNPAHCLYPAGEIVPDRYVMLLNNGHRDGRGRRAGRGGHWLGRAGKMGPFNDEPGRDASNDHSHACAPRPMAGAAAGHFRRFGGRRFEIDHDRFLQDETQAGSTIERCKRATGATRRLGRGADSTCRPRAGPYRWWIGFGCAK